MTEGLLENNESVTRSPLNEAMEVIHRFVVWVDRRATPSTLALLAGLVSLAVGCYELSLPHVLAGVSSWDEGYDEGVYVGAAIRFVHGVLPYRDFLLVHPPGFTLLFSPFALFGSAFGSHFTLELARCITVLVMALNVVLAGLIMRPLGRVATVTTSFALALWPLSIAVERAVVLARF
jgi:alpha-1,2-mannosyltransferase